MAKYPERYLGDAVIASFDGYQVWLRTDDGNSNQVALEPETFAALLRYVEEIKAINTAASLPSTQGAA